MIGIPFPVDRLPAGTVELAVDRITTGKPLVRRDERLDREESVRRKLALMLVLEWNQREDLSESEEAHLRGMSEKAMRGAKQNRDILPRI